MPRPLRIFSHSKIYHIILKGIDNQNIFYDDQDRNVFLKYLLLTKKRFEYSIYAYCLMNNHVHLVINVQDDLLSKAIQSLLVQYVHYFNRKYQRVGPLLQNRFKSKNVEDKSYFLHVCRYVHQNPENAYISKVADYQWSSYHEYIGKEKLIDKKVLLFYFNNDINNFIKFTNFFNKNDRIDDLADLELISKLSDDELSQILLKKFSLNSIDDISPLFTKTNTKKLTELILSLKNISGTNITQLSRVIRVNRKVIKNIWEKDN